MLVSLPPFPGFMGSLFNPLFRHHMRRFSRQNSGASIGQQDGLNETLTLPSILLCLVFSKLFMGQLLTVRQFAREQ